MRESPIWKCEVRVLDCVETIQTLFDGLTRVFYSLCETASLKTLCSTSWVKYIGLHVLGSLFSLMEPNEKLNVWYIDIDPTILQNTEEV